MRNDRASHGSDLNSRLRLPIHGDAGRRLARRLLLIAERNREIERFVDPGRCRP